MTRQKHLKQLVRDRMDKTGERYSTARRHVVRAAGSAPNEGPHLAGTVATTTALRVLLSTAGVRDPRTGKPFTEAMLFGIAGGIGIGVFAFVYEKEDFASFHIAGRHRWHDFESHLTLAVKRLGATVETHESSGAKPAEAGLRKMLEGGRPCVAWVDLASLPHRGMPPTMAGSGYHLITVYDVDDASKTARIGDLTDQPIVLPLAALTAARGRIKKDKHRLLALGKVGKMPPVADLVREGLRACHAGLDGDGAPKQAHGNFSLDAIRTWGERMHGSAGKDSWEKTFTPGKRLWRGLTMMHECIEYFGTGGGLCRPLFAEFLEEAGLAALGKEYAGLGKAWSELADAALPDDVPAFRRVKAVMAQRAELQAAGESSPEELGAVWDELDGLEAKAATAFPMSQVASSSLRQDLKRRILALYEEEVAARAKVGAMVS